MSTGNQTESIRIGHSAMTRSSIPDSQQTQVTVRTWISTASFLAILLIFSYRMTGFFFKLNSTAVIPRTVRSNASGSQVFGEEPYSGLAAVGVWLSENSAGNSGA